MCNNSPAEATSPENGWRSSTLPILDRKGSYGLYGSQSPIVVVSVEGTGVSQPEAAASEDFGGSSKYSSEILED